MNLEYILNNLVCQGCSYVTDEVKLNREILCKSCYKKFINNQPYQQYIDHEDGGKIKVKPFKKNNV